MKILLLSAYDAASHQRWRQQLQAHLPQYQWTQLSLPPRYFNWRLRGNSLSWAFGQREILQADYDLLIATSMVDLSALRGFVPKLAQLPTLVYFHENQFAYPVNDQQFNSVEPQMLSFYTALCGDALVFNSSFNRQSFFAGLSRLLVKLPDQVPKGLVEVLQARARVLPVPVELHKAEIQIRNNSLLTLVWNHRWEYDKGPDRLLAMLQRFFALCPSTPTQPSIRLHLLGQRFRQQPPAFDQIKHLLTEQGALGTWGYVEDQYQYQQLLQESHLVLSTALHDFQGLAVMDGVAAGAIPLVPARQAYPEWFAPEFCYPGYPDNPEQEAEAMAQALYRYWLAFQSGDLPQAPSLEHLSWSRLLPEYQALIHQLTGRDL